MDTSRCGDITIYHLEDMNTSILLVESQVILNRITGLSLKISSSAHSRQKRKAKCAWCIWRACVSKALPQMGNTVPYYLFDYEADQFVTDGHFWKHERKTAY